MTDRLHGLIVTLDQDIRDNDAQPLIDAIRAVRYGAAEGREDGCWA
jgi:hypothetical protein